MANTNIQLEQIKYKDLNSKQKERYNFQKIAGILADYGFSSIKLDDDWQGADFIANHIDGETFLKVQLKGRLTFDKKYENKNIFIAFPYENDWYLLDHDEVLELVKESIKNTSSWKDRGIYSWRSISRETKQLIEKYKVQPSTNNEYDAKDLSNNISDLNI